MSEVKRYCTTWDAQAIYDLESVVSSADYDAALAREAALREELAEVKRHVKNADMVFDLLRIACDATGETTALVYSKLGDMLNASAERDAIQQRLTVAEQRSAVMEKALSRIAREHDCGCSPCTGSCTSQVALEITVDAMRDIAIAALKPAADAKPSRSCPNCKVCMGSPDFPENCLINGVKP